MPRDGAIIFGDLIGKLGVLRVERGTSAIRLTTGIGAIIVDVAEVPKGDIIAKVHVMIMGASVAISA